MTDIDLIEVTEEDYTGTEMVVRQEQGQLIRAQSADDFVAKAAELAASLAGVIEKQGLYRQFGPKKHVQVEGWTTLGSMLGAVGLGVYAVPDGEPQEVEIDGVKGVKASMKAVTSDGTVIGGATGYCLRSEANWRSKDFYALAGMAQTRATSRALRQPLGWIMQLAGYEATPSEEMQGGEEPKKKARAKKQEKKEALNPALVAQFHAVQKELVDGGDERWQLDNVLSAASRAFGREITALADLDNTELKQIVDGAEGALDVAKVPFGENEEKTDA